MTRTRIIASLIGLGWLTPVWGQVGSGSISPELQALLVGLGAGVVGVGLLGWWAWFRLRQGRPVQKAAAGLVIPLPVIKTAAKVPEKEVRITPPPPPKQETKQERKERLKREEERAKEERKEKAAQEQAQKQAEAEKTRKERDEKEAQRQAQKQAQTKKERSKQAQEAEAAKQREAEKARAASEAEAERKRQQAEQEAQARAAQAEAEKQRAEEAARQASEQAARERAKAETRQKEAEAQAAREREEAEQERSGAVSPPLHETAGRMERGPGGEAKQPEVVAVKYAEIPADNGFAEADLYDSEGGTFKLTLYSNETATFEVLNNPGIQMLVDRQPAFFATVCELKGPDLSQQQPGTLRKNGSRWECVQKNIIG